MRSIWNFGRWIEIMDRDEKYQKVGNYDAESIGGLMTSNGTFTIIDRFLWISLQNQKVPILNSDSSGYGLMTSNGP